MSHDGRNDDCSTGASQRPPPIADQPLCRRFHGGDGPGGSGRTERKKFADAPTQAPERGSGLDPATSDMLAAMTDEAIEDLLDRVVLRLQEACAQEGRPRRTAHHRP